MKYIRIKIASKKKKIPITSNCTDDTTIIRESERLKKPLMRVKDKSEKKQKLKAQH